MLPSFTTKLKKMRKKSTLKICSPPWLSLQRGAEKKRYVKNHVSAVAVAAARRKKKVRQTSFCRGCVCGAGKKGTLNIFSPRLELARTEMRGDKKRIKNMFAKRAERAGRGGSPPELPARMACEAVEGVIPTGQ